MRLNPICAAVLTVAIAFFGIAGGLFFLRAWAIEAKLSDALERLGPALDGIRAIETDTQRTEAEIAGMANRSRNNLLTPKEKSALLAQATDVLDKTKVAVLNLGDAAKRLGDLAPQAGEAITRFSDDSHDTLTASQQMIVATTSDLTDPALEQTFLNIAESSARMVSTSAHFDSTASSLEASALDVQKFIHRETAPVRGTWNLIRGFVRDFGALGVVLAK